MTKPKTDRKLSKTAAMLTAAAILFALMSLGGVALAEKPGDDEREGMHQEWWENIPMPPELLQRALNDTARMRRDFSDKTYEYREAVKRGNDQLADRLRRDLHRLRHDINDRLRDVEAMGRKWREELRERRDEDRR